MSKSRSRSRSKSRSRSRSRSKSRSPARSPPKRIGRERGDSGKLFSLRLNNLSFNSHEDELRKKFDRFGDIGDIYLPMDRDTRKCRGFAFVRFYKKDDMLDAVDAFRDGLSIDGREIRVEQAEERLPPRDRGRRSRSPYRGGNNYRRDDNYRDNRRNDYNRRDNYRRDSRDRYDRRDSRDSYRRDRSRSRDRYRR